MNDARLDALFRSCVTAHLGNIDFDSVLGDESLTEIEQAEFMGIGVAMTGNMIGMIAKMWGCEPQEAWETICKVGREKNLPGMT